MLYLNLLHRHHARQVPVPGSQLLLLLLGSDRNKSRAIPRVVLGHVGAVGVPGGDVGVLPVNLGSTDVSCEHYFAQMLCCAKVEKISTKKSHLPDPLSLMTKISQANPPTLNPSGRLLHIGKAGQEVQLLSSLGLCQETILRIHHFKLRRI